MDPEPPASHDTLSISAASLHNPTLLDLPVDCLLRVLRLLHPFDLARIASTCTSLRLTADSDSSWSSNVPIYPLDLFPRLSMKQIYLHLRSQVRQQYWSDPTIVHGCFLIPARQLQIIWGEDTRYWQWRSAITGSWFSEVAELKAVCWLEIRGSCEMVFRRGRYVASFKIRLHDIRGFGMQPVRLSLSTSNGQLVECQRCFQGGQLCDPTMLAPLWELGDWLVLIVGEFTVDDEMLLKVDVSMMEIDSGLWKRGLVVDCLMIRPT